MASVNIPNVGKVNFPDNMSPEDIQRVIETEILGQKQYNVSDDFMRETAISATRAKHPVLAEAGDLLSGASGMVRGALNAITPSDFPLRENVERMRDIKISGALGERAAPVAPDQTRGLGDRLLRPEFADKGSGAYLAGQLLDPAAWATGLTATKVLPYAKIFGGTVKQGLTATGRNIVGGAIPGAVIGGLSDEGSAEGGAAFGAALNVIVPPTIKALGTGAVKAWTAMSPKLRGQRILQEILGDDLPAFAQAMARAQPGQTAAQAASGLNNDVLNAFDKLIRGMDESNYFSRLSERQRQDVVEGLVSLAGGRNATEARQIVEQSRRALGSVTEPAARGALKAANVAGRAQPRIARLEQEAADLGERASGKVEDVRRLSRAGQTAGNVARTGRMNLGGEPTPVLGQEGLALGQTPPPYSRGRELVDVAERGAQSAADESLVLGSASRGAKGRADSMRAELAERGLAPLDPSSITGAIRRKIRNPTIGPVSLNEKVLARVADKIDEWTNKYGVIDARALRSIRTNAVNDEIMQLAGGKMEPKVMQKRAAGLLAEVKPLIDNAIEAAGGKGWRQYLFDFERNSRLIDRKKMGGVALRRFDESPEKFQRLVEGNDPTTVQKIFKTEYDIGKAMGTKSMQALEAADAFLKRNASMAAGAKRGEEAAINILERNKASWILPNWINRSVAVTNRALKEGEFKINKKTLDTLNQAMRSGANANKILSLTPPGERFKMIGWLLKGQDNPKVRAFLAGFQNSMGEEQ